MFNPYLKENNYVGWFKRAIEEFGGEFIPIVVEKSLDKRGRRADSIENRRRKLDPLKYYEDDHGSIRKV